MTRCHRSMVISSLPPHYSGLKAVSLHEDNAWAFRSLSWNGFYVARGRSCSFGRSDTISYLTIAWPSAFKTL